MIDFTVSNSAWDTDFPLDLESLSALKYLVTSRFNKSEVRLFIAMLQEYIERQANENVSR